MVKKRLSFILLGLIVAGYLVLGALYAFRIPPWQSPDEPAHYNYVAQIVNDGCCPVIEPGDWDSAYLDEVKGANFPPEADLSPIQYEDHQPPLYYLIASLVYNFTGGELVALRLLSVAFGPGWFWRLILWWPACFLSVCLWPLRHRLLWPSCHSIWR